MLAHLLLLLLLLLHFLLVLLLHLLLLPSLLLVDDQFDQPVLLALLTLHKLVYQLPAHLLVKEVCHIIQS